MISDQEIQKQESCLGEVCHWLNNVETVQLSYGSHDNMVLHNLIKVILCNSEKYVTQIRLLIHIPHPIHCFNMQTMSIVNIRILSENLLCSLGYLSVTVSMNVGRSIKVTSHEQQCMWFHQMILYKKLLLHYLIMSGYVFSLFNFTRQSTAWSGGCIGVQQTYPKYQIARFMGPTWGPSGANRTQVGSHDGPTNLAILDI